MMISKTIEEMDKEFAKEANMTYEEFKNMDSLERSHLMRKITNKRLKNRNK